jgi:hypothetical protein
MSPAEVTTAATELVVHLANTFGADSAASIEARELADSLNRKVFAAVRYLFRPWAAADERTATALQP